MTEQLEQAMAVFADIAAQRQRAVDHALYERLKADFVRQFPGATPAQYTDAMVRLARLCGVEGRDMNCGPGDVRQRRRHARRDCP